jgi:hypothetical protein
VLYTRECTPVHHEIHGRGGALCARGRAVGRRRLGEETVPVPEAPQTIRQNWIPFLTFFLRRIIFCILELDQLLGPEWTGWCDRTIKRDRRQRQQQAKGNGDASSGV